MLKHCRRAFNRWLLFAFGLRQPTGTEMNACIEYVQEELAIIQPKVIVALGKTAVEGLLQRDVAITRLRGQWREYRGIPLMPTFILPM